MKEHEALRAIRSRDWTILGLSTLFLVVLAMLFHLTPEPAHLVKEHQFTLRAEWLYGEHGLYESASVVFLLGAAVVALAGLRRVPSGQSRVMLLWFAALAMIAAMREMDMHILMNPEYLGSWGVRYRIDWWLDFDVPLLLKLSWAGIFAVVAIMLTLPLFRYRKETLRFLFDFRDPSVQLLMLTGALMAVGFTIDDLLRSVELLSGPIKATIEEGAETLGALCFFLATIGCVTVAISSRSQRQANRSNE